MALRNLICGQSLGFLALSHLVCGEQLGLLALFDLVRGEPLRLLALSRLQSGLFLGFFALGRVLGRELLRLLALGFRAQARFLYRVGPQAGVGQRFGQQAVRLARALELGLDLTHAFAELQLHRVELLLASGKL